MANSKTYIEEQPVDHDEFMEGEESDRHEQLINALNRFATALNNSNDTEIAKAIGENNSQIGRFINELRNLKFEVPTPKVTVVNNQDKIAVSINEATISITKSQTEIINLLQQILDSRITEWKIRITQRDADNLIYSATLKAGK